MPTIKCGVTCCKYNSSVEEYKIKLKEKPLNLPIIGECQADEICFVDAPECKCGHIPDAGAWQICEQFEVWE